MRVRPLASASRGALSRHAPVASISNSLSLLISYQVSHYDVFLRVLSFNNIPTYLLRITVILLCILCHYVSLTQLILVAMTGSPTYIC